MYETLRFKALLTGVGLQTCECLILKVNKNLFTVYNSRPCHRFAVAQFNAAYLCQCGDTFEFEVSKENFDFMENWFEKPGEKEMDGELLLRNKVNHVLFIYVDKFLYIHSGISCRTLRKSFKPLFSRDIHIENVC